MLLLLAVVVVQEAEADRVFSQGYAKEDEAAAPAERVKGSDADALIGAEIIVKNVRSYCVVNLCLRLPHRCFVAHRKY